MEVAHAFSGQLRGRDRFGIGRWEIRDGLPVLRNAQASLGCTLVKTLDHGTHSIFLGRVDAVVVAQKVAPLIYQDGVYAHAISLESFVAA